MPFYIGEGMEAWDAQVKRLDEEEEDCWRDPDPSAFDYVAPEYAPSGEMPFPATPGRKPAGPDDQPAPPKRPNFLQRLFGAKPAPPPRPEWSVDQFRRDQAALSALALWDVSRLAADLREHGVQSVRGAYDGGNDESFGHVRGVEMVDGRRLEPGAADLPVSAQQLENLIERAADAFMGRYDAGPFSLHGQLRVDVVACVIKDERDRDAVFAGL